jgi:hypothetical protein
VLALTLALNASVGLEVLGNQDTTANVKTMQTPLSDAAFLRAELTSISGLASEPARLAAIAALVNHSDPGPGGFYDNLGATDVTLAPHLDPGQGAATDPSFYFTPLRVGPTAKSLDAARRRAWSQYAMSFFDSSTVRLRYEGLQPSKVYQAHVVFNSMPDAAKTKATNVSGVRAHGQGGDRMRLVAAAGEGGKAATVWPPPPQEYSLPPSPMAKTVVSIPHELTRGGRLTLSCATSHRV